MNRREFCRRFAILGGSVALSPVIKACSPISQDERTATSTSSPAIQPPPADTLVPAPTPQPTLSPAPDPTATGFIADDPSLSKIALVKTRDRSKGVRDAITLLDAGGYQGDRLLLKPNFNSAHESPGSTHPDILRALVIELQEMGARSITVGDRSGMGNTRTVMQQKGIFDLATDLGLDVVAFDELQEEEWSIIRSNDFHWADGFAVPRLLLDSDRVVQTCNLKTHRYGGHFTMALKNSVGLAAKSVDNGGRDYMQELHNSPFQRPMIAEINTAYSPALIVMDGVEAFVDGGPDTGKKVDSEVILAATDPIAIDAVGVAILRWFGTTAEVSRGRIFEQEQIARAIELGLGVGSPEKIQIITSDSESEAYAQQIAAILGS